MNRFMVQTTSALISLIVIGETEKDALLVSIQALKASVRPVRILDDNTAAELWTLEHGFNKDRKEEIPKLPEPFWENPWTEAIRVPVNELISAIGAHWILLNRNPKLDAYILESPSGWHSAGVRYGPEGREYYSPNAEKGCLDALIKKYKR